MTPIDGYIPFALRLSVIGMHSLCTLTRSEGLQFRSRCTETISDGYSIFLCTKISDGYSPFALKLCDGYSPFALRLTDGHSPFALKFSDGYSPFALRLTDLQSLNTKTQ